MPQNPCVILFDLEYTSWEGSLERNWSGETEHREIVQFGALAIDRRTLAERGSLNLLVRPEINPVLSDYFIALTGIDNDMLAAEGLSFVDALSRFVAFCGDAPRCSYGNDESIISENLALLGLEDTARPGPWINLRPWFQDQGVPTSQVGSGSLPDHFSLESTRRRHDALDDCHGIRDALHHLLVDESRSPWPWSRDAD